MYTRQSAHTFTLFSTSFTHDGLIPSIYTCDGKNISPEFHWEHTPPGTQSFAFIIDDPDAPHGVFVHWVLYNIPATYTSFPEDYHPSSEIQQGLNDFGLRAYGGPCPPSGTHRYVCTLYALDTMLPIKDDFSKDALVRAMNAHIIGKAVLLGRYQRS